MSTSAVSVAKVDVVTVDEDEDEGELDDGSEGNGEGEREGKVVLDERGEKSVSAALTVVQVGEDGVAA
jgi:hypothetical protein